MKDKTETLYHKIVIRFSQRMKNYFPIEFNLIFDSYSKVSYFFR